VQNWCSSPTDKPLESRDDIHPSQATSIACYWLNHQRAGAPHLISENVGALPEPAYEALLKPHEESDENRRKESASLQTEEEG